MTKKRVLFIAAEGKPFAKAGGVGDVSGEFPPALKKAGIDIEIVLPCYSFVPQPLRGERIGQFIVTFAETGEAVTWFKTSLEGVTVHLLANATYFGSEIYIHSDDVPFKDDARRFSFFSKAALEVVQQRQPDIVHINDWVLGYLFGWMQLKGLPQKRVLTIHNVAYQGNIGKNEIHGWDMEEFLQHAETRDAFTDPRADWHSVNALQLAIELADIVTTVSPTYAREIQEPSAPERHFDGGHGLDDTLRGFAARQRLVGILNGFDYAQEPTAPALMAARERKAREKAALAPYFRRPKQFMIGFVGRAVDQKFRLLAEVLHGRSILEHIVDMPAVNVAMLATGLPEYESFISHMGVRRYAGTATYADLLRLPRRDNFFAAVAFDKALAGRISFASDVLLMPSVFEPCGITQLEAMANATPPIVRRTGGLADTVTGHPANGATGFVFDGSNREQLLTNFLDVVTQAARLFSDEPERFAAIQEAAFAQRFLWKDSAERYITKVYHAVQ